MTLSELLPEFRKSFETRVGRRKTSVDHHLDTGTCMSSCAHHLKDVRMPSIAHPDRLLSPLSSCGMLPFTLGLWMSQRHRLVVAVCGYVPHRDIVHEACSVRGRMVGTLGRWRAGTWSPRTDMMLKCSICFGLPSAQREDPSPLPLTDSDIV
jgi:hypothetical protein